MIGCCAATRDIVNISMTVPPRYHLSEAEKEALLLEQAALIERLAARVAELEALVGKPRRRLRRTPTSHPRRTAPAAKPPRQNGSAKHGHRVPVSRGRLRPTLIAPSVAWPRVVRIAKRHWRRRHSAVDTATITSTCQRFALW